MRKNTVLDLNVKLRDKNMFHDETRQAGVNLVQAAQFILNNSSVDEALFYIEHVREQMLVMKKNEVVNE